MGCPRGEEEGEAEASRSTLGGTRSVETAEIKGGAGRNLGKRKGDEKTPSQPPLPKTKPASQLLVTGQL